MSLKASDRYGSTRDLADELERWLAAEPVRAWPEPWTVKTRRWTSRHRVLVSSAAACLVVASVALVVGIVLVSQANADLENANQTISKREGETKHANKELGEANAKLAKSEKEAREGRDLAEDRLATSTMMLAKSRFEENQALLADDLLEEVPVKFRFSAWGLLKNYVAGSLFTLRGHSAAVTSVAFAKDGQVLPRRAVTVR